MPDCFQPRTLLTFIVLSCLRRKQVRSLPGNWHLGDIAQGVSSNNPPKAELMIMMTESLTKNSNLILEIPVISKFDSSDTFFFLGVRLSGVNASLIV